MDLNVKIGERECVLWLKSGLLKYYTACDKGTRTAQKVVNTICWLACFHEWVNLQLKIHKKIATTSPKVCTTKHK